MVQVMSLQCDRQESGNCGYVMSPDEEFSREHRTLPPSPLPRKFLDPTSFNMTVFDETRVVALTMRLTRRVENSAVLTDTAFVARVNAYPASNTLGHRSPMY